MLVCPPDQEIWPVGETAHHSVDVVLSYGLQDDAAELVFEKFDLGAGLNPVLAPEFGRDHKLALRSKCSTHILHGLHRIRCKSHPGWLPSVMSGTGGCLTHWETNSPLELRPERRKGCRFNYYGSTGPQ